MILPHTWKTIWYINIILWGNDRISFRRTHGAPYRGYGYVPLRFGRNVVRRTQQVMSQYDLMLALKTKVGHCDLYFMVQWFWHILKTIWCINMIPWANESIWLDARLQTKNGSLWPIFHGSVIIPPAYEVRRGVYSFRLSVRSSVLPCVRASLWPLFHGPEILPYILKTVWCMKMIAWDNESV